MISFVQNQHKILEIREFSDFLPTYCKLMWVNWILTRLNWVVSAKLSALVSQIFCHYTDRHREERERGREREKDGERERDRESAMERDAGENVTYYLNAIVTPDPTLCHAWHSLREYLNFFSFPVDFTTKRHCLINTHSVTAVATVTALCRTFYLRCT